MSKAKSKKGRSKYQNIKSLLFLTLFCILNFGVICSTAFSVSKLNQEKEHEKRLNEAITFCENLFNEDSTIRSEYGKAELLDCESRLDEIEKNNLSQELDKIKTLRIEISDAYGFIDWINKANEYIENNIVKEDFTEQDLVELTESHNNLAEQYKEITGEKLENLRSEYEAMRSAEEGLSRLFTSDDKETVRLNVTRAEYNDIKARIENLKQEGLKNRLSELLDKVLSSIENQEKIAREKAEQARKAMEEERKKIAESWHKLDISPFYINQFSAGIYNGCEAASLLMALKYKGYARGVDYHSFAMNMPTSDDPNTGFYLSMTELEPKNEAHWIAPAPLARYGLNYGGAINVSGYSLDQLDNEIRNGNPVVIYLTYAMKNPKEYSRGVPKNLHVVVLAGFNSHTGEQIIYDPWPLGSAATTLSKGRTEYLYNASGRRAVVIR